MDDTPLQKYGHLKDPGIRAFLEEGERLYPDNAVSFTLEEQRAFYDVYCAHFSKGFPSGLVREDFKVGHISCRRYVPKDATGATVLYLHGGGFVVGGLESHDDICAEIAAGAGTTVVAVAYRLAPEHPFPAAFDDCWTVMRHLIDGGASIVVAGDSAGGNLAAALALKARDEGLSLLRGQVLIYPGLGGDVTKGSYVSQAQAPGHTTEDVLYYRNTYKGGSSKYAEPLRETDYRNVAPAFLVAAALDPLHDDCVVYAARLRNAGVAAEVREEPLLMHAFLRARHMSMPAAASFEAIVAAVRRFKA